MTECYCGSYEGCPIHCDRCKKAVGYRPSCPPLCDVCFDFVFGGKDLEREEDKK